MERVKAKRGNDRLPWSVANGFQDLTLQTKPPFKLTRAAREAWLDIVASDGVIAYLLHSLPDVHPLTSAWRGFKLGRAIFSGRRQNHAERIPVDLVDSQAGFSPSPFFSFVAPIVSTSLTTPSFCVPSSLPISARVTV